MLTRDPSSLPTTEPGDSGPAWKEESKGAIAPKDVMAWGTQRACGFLSNRTPKFRPSLCSHTRPAPCWTMTARRRTDVCPPRHTQKAKSGPTPQLGSDAGPFLPPHLCWGCSLHLECTAPTLAPPALPPVLCGLAQTHASSRDLCLLNSAHLVPTDSRSRPHISWGRGPKRPGLTAPGNKPVALTLFLQGPARGAVRERVSE